MKSIYFILSSLLLIGCSKADIVPTSPKSNINAIKNVSVAKVDTLKSTSYGTDTDISNPDYWYNGTKGTALIQITGKDCTAIATIGTTSIPFMFNANGVGVLKYTPAPGLLIQLAVCPGSNKSVKAEIFNSKNNALYSYSGILTGNWSGTYTIQ